MVIKERFVGALYEVEGVKLKEGKGDIFTVSTGLPGVKLDIKFADVLDYDFMITHDSRIGLRVVLSGDRGVMISPDDIVVDITPFFDFPQIPPTMSMRQLKSDFSQYKKNPAPLGNKAKNKKVYDMMKYLLESAAKAGIDASKMLSELDTLAQTNKIIP